MVNGLANVEGVNQNESLSLVLTFYLLKLKKMLKQIKIVPTQNQ